MAAAAVALKMAVEDPAATVTEGGTVSRGLLLARITVPPEVCDKVTAQTLTALWITLEGVQAKLETSVGATRLRGAVCVLAPKVAVTVAL